VLRSHPSIWVPSLLVTLLLLAVSILAVSFAADAEVQNRVIAAQGGRASPTPRRAAWGANEGTRAGRPRRGVR
jgi:hypothetical protein